MESLPGRVFLTAGHSLFHIFRLMPAYYSKNKTSRIIILTGGGTAGHVMPNLALLPILEKAAWQANYIGSRDGIENRLISGKIPFYSVSTGKLRRYFDLKNFTDGFRVLLGIYQAWLVLRRIKPRLIFSKGGFVSVPVVVAARLLNLPVILHESDITPGLANKILIPFSQLICTAFPETAKHVPNKKWVYMGIPVRESLFKGNRAKGLEYCNFNEKKPVLLVMGGSLGAGAINLCLRASLSKLLERFQVAHICGKGKRNPEQSFEGYVQFEFITEELPHLFAAADVIVSRAGANSIFEILALKKPNLLIPLSLKASRGDQIQNADSFKEQGFSRVLEEEFLTPKKLVAEIQTLFHNKQVWIKAIERHAPLNSAAILLQQIDLVLENKR